MSKRAKPATPIELFTRMMFTRIITALARLLRDEALSLPQIAALHLVDQAAGKLRLAELAELLGLSASATSRLVDGLVQRDLLGRAEDPEDRRNKSLTMTDAGHAFIRRIDADRAQTVLAVVETLPKALVTSIMAAVREFGAREP
jgi:DNA-binding MarR family transcriptional regulator